MRSEAKSSIWSVFFDLKTIFIVIRSEFFLRSYAKYRNFSDLKQALFSFDIKRIFSCDLQQNRLSEVNLWIKSEIFYQIRILLLYKAFFCDMKRIFLRYEAKFFTIWSEFYSDLKLNSPSELIFFRSAANCYCDIKQIFIAI